MLVKTRDKLDEALAARSNGRLSRFLIFLTAQLDRSRPVSRLSPRRVQIISSRHLSLILGRDEASLEDERLRFS